MMMPCWESVVDSRKQKPDAAESSLSERRDAGCGALPPLWTKHAEAF